MVICLERDADLHMAHPGSPGKRAVKRVCVCVCSAEIYFKVKSQNILEAVSVLHKFLTYYGKTCNY